MKANRRERGRVVIVLDYSRERAKEALMAVRSAVLATSGPAGVLASEFACEAKGLSLYLLLPRTSDHLFNLEHCTRVALVTPEWELAGQARALLPDEWPELRMLSAIDTQWYVLVEVEPAQFQIRRRCGWGAAETIDLAAT